MIALVDASESKVKIHNGEIIHFILHNRSYNDLKSQLLKDDILTLDFGNEKSYATSDRRKIIAFASDQLYLEDDWTIGQALELYPYSLGLNSAPAFKLDEVMRLLGISQSDIISDLTLVQHNSLQLLLHLGKNPKLVVLKASDLFSLGQYREALEDLIYSLIVTQGLTIVFHGDDQLLRDRFPGRIM